GGGSRILRRETRERRRGSTGSPRADHACRARPQAAENGPDRAARHGPSAQLVPCHRAHRSPLGSPSLPMAEMACRGSATWSSCPALRGLSPLALVVPGAIDRRYPALAPLHRDLGFGLQLEGRLIQASDPNLDERALGVGRVEEPRPRARAEAAALLVPPRARASSHADAR